MITKRQVNLGEFFHPLSNTPAVNVFRDLPKRQAGEPQPASIDVLALEWGDPRSILFSLHTEDFTPQTGFKFTCSDREPAILARNVFLLTLVADGFENSGSKDNLIALAWRAFFHLCISDSTIFAVHDRAEKLAKCSTSLQAWKTSPYGKWIHFIDQDSLRRVHDIWYEYAALPMRDTFEPSGAQAMAGKHRRCRDASFVVQGVRSAGFHAEQSLPTLSAALDAYWQTGVVGGNKQDVAQLSERPGVKTGLHNPLFVMRSAVNNEFTVPYGMDPLVGFHLAPAFEEGDDCDPEVVNRLVNTAKGQFRDWVTTFGAYIKANRVEFHLQCGDAINFCYALQACNPQVPSPPEFSYVYKNAWTATRSQFLDRPPLFFDVIETSNIAEKAGILNLFPAVVPLLRPQSSSILYTESLLRLHGRSDVVDLLPSFMEALCSDICTMALLTGIAPVEFLTGVSANSFIAENTLREAFEEDQFRMRIPWRITTIAEDYLLKGLKACKPAFTARSFCVHLIRLYELMFKHEAQVAGPTSAVALIFGDYLDDQRYYTRTSFAILLNLFRSRVHADWNETLSLFLAEFQDHEHALVGKHFVQELQLQFHALGLAEIELLQAAPRELGESPFDMFPPNDKDAGLLGQEDVPEIVYVCLVVPRHDILWFANDNRRQSITLHLHVSVSHDLGEDNRFESFQCFFGKLVQSEEIGICYVEEDSAGWDGASDLIVVCQVPLYTLLHGPREGLSVSFGFDPLPQTYYFIQKRGGNFNIFKTGLHDERRLQILRKPPTTARDHEARGELLVPRSPPSVPEQSETVEIRFNPMADAGLMVFEKAFPPGSPIAEAIPRNTVVGVQHDTMFSFAVTTMEGYEYSRVYYPYPFFMSSIDPCLTKDLTKGPETRLLIRVQPAFSDQGAPAKGILPFSRDTYGSLFLWALPHVVLRTAPKIFQSQKNVDAVKALAKRGISKEDNRQVHHWFSHAPEAQERCCPNPVTLVKMSVSSIVANIAIDTAAGKPPLHITGKTVVLIPDTQDSDPPVALVITALRHDFSADSVFLDGYTIPMDREEVKTAMGNAMFATVRTTMKTPGHEMCWYQFLIASAERCRSYSHRDDCIYGDSSPYGAPGTNLAWNLAISPRLCRCGEGLLLEDFPPESPLVPAKQFATRVAIPILFTVPYLNSIDDQGLAKWEELARFFTQSFNLDGRERCASCGVSSDALKKCLRCKKVKYCNVTCQKNHWGLHKKTCREQETTEHQNE